MKSLLFIFLSLLPLIAAANPPFPKTVTSFAEEYKTLRILLEKVTDSETAIKYKAQIEQEIQRLSTTQYSGAEHFNSLSKLEQKLFVKRFQMNRFHCGEVTQVMQQRRRILFDPKLSKVLSKTLNNIP